MKPGTAERYGRWIILGLAGAVLTIAGVMNNDAGLAWFGGAAIAALIVKP